MVKVYNLGNLCGRQGLRFGTFSLSSANFVSERCPDMNTQATSVKNIAQWAYDKYMAWKFNQTDLSINSL